MTPEELKERIPESAFIFIASRSSGPGGQNVNKVNTKAELRINILSSGIFSDEEKKKLLERLAGRINKAGELVVRSQSQRSQAGNRSRTLEKILLLMASALTEEQERIRTSPTRASVTRRLDEKRRHGMIKQMRGKREGSGETE